MYETDLERLMAQARRIQQLGREVLDDVETLQENEVDPAAGSGVGKKQVDLQDELERAISNFGAALERSDSVGRRPEYEHGPDTFRAEYDPAAEEVAFTYLGEDKIAPSEIDLGVFIGDVEKNGIVSGAIQPGETFTVDVGGEPSETVVELRWRSVVRGGNALPNAGRAPIDRSTLPEDDLVKDESAHSVSVVIG